MSVDAATTHRVAPLRGHEMAWWQHGELGPPVLLVMGFGMSSDAWRPQFDDLSADHRVARYDNRGIHRSTAGEGPHDLPALADDAAALLDHLGWDSAHVVGISMGGMIAQHLALRHRARLRSLSLLATHAGGGLLHTRPAIDAIRLFVRANTTRGPARLEALSELLFTPAHRDRLRAQGWTPDQLTSVAKPSDPRIRLAHLRSMLRHDVRRDLARLAGLPTLVLKPVHDRLVPPRCSEEIAASLPGARLVEVAAGHGLLVEATQAVNHALRAHVAAAEAAR